MFGIPGKFVAAGVAVVAGWFWYQNRGDYTDRNGIKWRFWTSTTKVGKDIVTAYFGEPLQSWPYSKAATRVLSTPIEGQLVPLIDAFAATTPVA